VCVCVWISEQTAIIYAHSTNRLGFITGPFTARYGLSSNTDLFNFRILGLGTTQRLVGGLSSW